jgi:hypothetical protein
MKNSNTQNIKVSPMKKLLFGVIFFFLILLLLEFIIGFA